MRVPKRVVKASASALIKKEPCLNKHQVPQQFRNKLRSAPDHVKAHYESMKHAKSGSSQAKQDFVNHVISAEQWDGDFFGRLCTVSVHDGWSTVGEWISWKQLHEKADPAVIRLA